MYSSGSTRAKFPRARQFPACFEPRERKIYEGKLFELGNVDFVRNAAPFQSVDFRVSTSIINHCLCIKGVYYKLYVPRIRKLDRPIVRNDQKIFRKKNAWGLIAIRSGFYRIYKRIYRFAVLRFVCWKKRVEIITSISHKSYIIQCLEDL